MIFLEKTKWYRWKPVPLFLLLSVNLFCQSPVLEVDIDYSGRNLSEVHEPDYLSWIVEDDNKTTLEGVTFEFKNGGISESWYKAGVQSPNYARLVNDGVKTSKIELHITGLSAGTHSLVSIHNNFDNPDAEKFGPIDIYLNDEIAYNNFMPTTRSLSNEAAATAYLEFDVDENDTVVILFQSDPPDDTYNTTFTICGFYLNTVDPNKLIRSQYPEDLDEHVDIDNDTLEFSWSAPANGTATSYNVYLGTDENAVRLATPDSVDFLGTIADTSFVRTGFYSMDSYYWRVDPITPDDTTKGNVTYFKKRIHAFPGAEGYGGYAIGGRGGKVIYVTNLDDSGVGSFRDAVENYSGSRTILFAVSGIITLEDRLVINDDYVTVAGQTAPGRGVCFRWAPIGVTGDNLIVQNIRLRLGIGVTYDGMGLTGAQYSIIDHCSISWTIDEAFSSRGAKNITLQRTLISEALNAAGHENYSYGTEHGYAGSIGGDIGSFHHNLLAHCNGRNWSMAGGLDGDSYYAGRLDLFNNIVYNWGSRATDGGAHEVNFVGNYYKKGAATSQSTIMRAQLEGTGNGSQSYYTHDNIVENTSGTFACDGTNDACSRTYETSNGQVVDWDVFVEEPFFISEATVHSASDAYKLVLSDVGCTQPVFDDHDIRIVDETLNGTYSCKGSYTSKPGLPDHESDIGSWETYPGYKRAANWDTDLDGLPDWWEDAIGTDPNSASGDFSESNADDDLNGYTNLEEYLQWMGSPHYFLEEGGSIDIDLSKFTRGFTNAPVYEISNIVGGDVTNVASDSVVRFNPSGGGIGGFTFTVTDTEGTDMEQQIGIYAGVVADDSGFAYTYYLDRDETTLITIDSGATSMNDDVILADQSPEIQLYPNPVVDDLHVLFNSGIGSRVTIKVLDITGKVINANEYAITQAEPAVTIDLHGIKAGIYLLSVQNNEFRACQKFLKRE